MENLSSDLKEKLISKGASLVGFCDLSQFQSEIRKGFKFGISIGVALKPEVVSKLDDGPTHEYYNEYLEINKQLDELAIFAAKFLEQCGYSAFPMTSSNVVEDEKTRRTALPHKTFATRSGIGWIGKCALLVNEKFGSAIRLTSVLTDAVLEVGTPINSSKCGACDKCKKACPGNAVKGLNWEVDTDRDKFFNYADCRKAARERAAKISVDASICGRCIYVCPWTQSYLTKKGCVQK